MKYTLAALAAMTLTSNAALITVADTGAINNQAGFAVALSQTFTTGVLGGDNVLNTITIQGPSSGTSASAAFIEIYADNDGNSATWDPGASLAVSAESHTIAAGAGFTFNFLGTGFAMADNTVYGILFTDGAGNAIANMRTGLTNAGLEAGTEVFNNGAIPFGGGFDLAMEVTAVPEPSSTALLGLGGLALILRRRK